MFFKIENQMQRVFLGSVTALDEQQALNVLESNTRTFT